MAASGEMQGQSPYSRKYLPTQVFRHTSESRMASAFRDPVADHVLQEEGAFEVQRQEGRDDGAPVMSEMVVVLALGLPTAAPPGRREGATPPPAPDDGDPDEGTTISSSAPPKKTAKSSRLGFP